MKTPVLHKRSVWGVYWGFTRQHPVLLSTVIVGSIGLQLAALAAPLYLRQFFNALASATPSPEIAHALAITLGITVGIWFLEWLFRRIQDTATMHLEVRVMANLFTSSYEYLLNHSYNFFASNFAGSLTHKVNKFSQAYETVFDSIFWQFGPTALFVVGASGVLFYHNHILGTALGVWSVLFVAFQVYVSYLRQPIRVARSEAATAVTANLADTISNQHTIALFSGVEHEFGRFGATVERWKKALMRSWNADMTIWSIIGLFMIAIESGLMFGALHFWKLGLVTVGDFVLVQAYLLTTFDRLVSINRELRRVHDAYADADEMVRILNTTHEVSDKPGAKALAVHNGVIEFKDVDFHFHAEKAVFEDFNLKIRGGEKVALIGPSGAGKSTITKLLLRLFDVKEGSIEIDGQNIADVTQESLRSAIAFVPQEPILFHRSLMENIRYGRRDASDEEVFEAARKAHCHEFISKLEKGYETFVGERGIKLSGGERQRVAIARAILKNAPILMLDEATSSLDSESEVLIQDALATLMQGKTVIVIAHRLSTIMKMDRIIGIKSGRIAEEGTHHELLAKNGLYAALWNHQAGGFIQDENES